MDDKPDIVSVEKTFELVKKLLYPDIADRCTIHLATHINMDRWLQPPHPLLHREYSIRIIRVFPQDTSQQIAYAKSCSSLQEAYESIKEQLGEYNEKLSARKRTLE